jgi:hypothetical protein
LPPASASPLTRKSSSAIFSALKARTLLEEPVYPAQPEEESEVLAEGPQQSADETNSALANQT